MRTVLLIAFHYPPCATSSGLQRSLANSIHLPDYGWRTVVLTVTPEAHQRTSDQQLRDIPVSVVVARTRARNLSQMFAVGSRYWSRLAIPDPWRAWSWSAIPRGLALIKEHQIDAIWSTYPIATAHTIGAALAKRTGLPWIADFRDPMVETIASTGEVFPADPRLRKARLQIESLAMRHAAHAVFCTPSAQRIVRDRYPQFPPQRLAVISNGFDEAAFAAAEQLVTGTPSTGRRVLLHSGIIYPGPDRDPAALFAALARLAAAGIVSPENFELRLRDPSNEASYAEMARVAGVANLVSILPPLKYHEALAEMLQADGLLLLQGYTSNPAIPAKLYEYLRAGRSIVGLVHPEGESAAALRAAGITLQCDLTDTQHIAAVLRQWLEGLAGPTNPLPGRDYVAQFGRAHLAGRLASLLDQSVAGG